MYITDLPVHHRIVSAISDRGFSELTEIQEKAILPALAGKDIMASSQTGSGKTLAFLIPTIHRLLKQKALSKQDPRALILAPTRELAKQVFIEVKKLIANSPLSATLIVGGENYNDQIKTLRRNPPILVGTAGRIADHLDNKNFFLNGLELLILDEADRMLDLGFSQALLAINKCANHRKRQTMMFSATLDNISVKDLATKLVKTPVRVNVGSSTAKHQDIQQTFYFSDSIQHKDNQLLHLLQHKEYNQGVVFTATRDDTLRIAAWLNQQNIAQLDATAIHGNLAQNQRAAIMSAFSRGQHSLLITTDLASRGLDLPKVGLVVNFDLPNEPDEYVHRIGRTGRSGAKGEAVSFVSKRDWRSFLTIEAHLDYSINCSNYAPLPAKFNGLANPQKNIKKSKKVVNNPKQKSDVKKKRGQRVNVMSGREIGDLPVIRRKKE